MSRRLLVAGFATEHDILHATQSAREHGWSIVDVYTPYAVHGLDRAMGLLPSRLPWACLICGLIGTLFAFWFQYWALAVNWPINVGGRPWNSLPAYVPVAFEVMVLFGGFGVALAFFIRCGLWPGKQALVPAAGVTDDRFVLILAETDAAFVPEQVRRTLEAFSPIFIEEREQDGAGQ